LTVSERLRLSLPPNKNAPGLARNFVVDHGSALPDDVMNDAELLVSELVSNAVLHGSPAITLCVDVDPPRIEVGVRDEGKALPTPAVEPPPPSLPRGRGLVIVDRLANSWGVTPTDPPPGKTVWFELGTAAGR
jgi:anti-sigma regulatory factor (Ser/Thr protein kinase)